MQELPFDSAGAAQDDAFRSATAGACDTAGVEMISAVERQTLEGRWNKGGLDEHREQVLAFVCDHRAAILELAGGSREPDALAHAAGRRIAALRTVHHPSEMQAQVAEINNEMWYCGERGDYDHQRIKLEWIIEHAANWRDWRIKEYLFVTGRCAAEISEVINVVCRPF